MRNYILFIFLISTLFSSVVIAGKKPYGQYELRTSLGGIYCYKKEEARPTNMDFCRCKYMTTFEIKVKSDGSALCVEALKVDEKIIWLQFDSISGSKNTVTYPMVYCTYKINPHNPDLCEKLNLY